MTNEDSRNSTPMNTALDTYQLRVKERDELVETLRMWNKVQEQGINPNDVARFALRTEFMTQSQKRDFRALKFAKGRAPQLDKDGRYRCHPTHANCVVKKDGEVVKLDPWVKLP